MAEDEHATEFADALESAYGDAFDEWQRSGEAAIWEITASDGLHREGD